MDKMSVWQQYKKLAIFAVFIAVLINLCTGLQNCWGVLSHGMISEYGWSAVEATRPYSMITTISAFWSIVAGRWGDKYGHKWPIIFGAACMGAGLILSSMHQNPLLMCVTAGMLLGLSSSSMTCNTAGNSMQWVPASKKGLAVGLVTCGFAISSMYMSPLINMLVHSNGVLGTFRIMGALAIIPIVLALFVLPDSRGKKYKEISLSISAPDPAKADAIVEDHSKYKNTLTPNQVLKTKEFWACFLLYFCGAIGGQLFVSQAVTIAHVQIPAWQGAAILVTLLAFANFLGRICWPTLADKFGPMRMTRLMQGACAINWFLFALYQTPALMIMGCLVLGFTFGGNIPMLWQWCSHCFGTKYISSIQGMATTAWGVSGIIGPMMAAYLMDTTGSYRPAFIIVGVLCCVGVALSFLIKNNYDNDPTAVKLDAQA